MFAHFAEYLNERTSQRERVVKLSREITIQSKNIIFLLHRLSKDGGDADSERILGEAAKAMRHVGGDLVGEQMRQAVAFSWLGPSPQQGAAVGDVFFHSRSWRQGLQEYLESCCFHYFLTGGGGGLLTLDALLRADGPYHLAHGALPVTAEDFLLGMCDTTGEVMRYCINVIARGRFAEAERCVEWLRAVTQQCDALQGAYGASIYDLRKKMAVMHQSLEKVELALYHIRLLQLEYSAEEVAQMLDQGIAAAAAATTGRDVEPSSD